MNFLVFLFFLFLCLAKNQDYVQNLLCNVQLKISIRIKEFYFRGRQIRAKSKKNEFDVLCKVGQAILNLDSSTPTSFGVLRPHCFLAWYNIKTLRNQGFSDFRSKKSTFRLFHFGMNNNIHTPPTIIILRRNSNGRIGGGW